MDNFSTYINKLNIELLNNFALHAICIKDPVTQGNVHPAVLDFIINRLVYKNPDNSEIYCAYDPATLTIFLPEPQTDINLPEIVIHLDNITFHLILLSPPLDANRLQQYVVKVLDKEDLYQVSGLNIPDIAQEVYKTLGTRDFTLHKIYINNFQTPVMLEELPVSLDKPE